MSESKDKKEKWTLSKDIIYGRQSIDLGEYKGSIDIWYHSGDTIKKEEAIANGYIICASKDLLEALEEMIKWYSHRDHKPDLINPMNLQPSEIIAAMKAVNKALNQEKYK